MSEVEIMEFSHSDIATALLKQKGIHEGIWMISIKFGISGINVGSSNQDMNPAAVVPVLGIGLTRSEKKNNLTVDAAVVNPK